jgi:hypothetical protein
MKVLPASLIHLIFGDFMQKISQPISHFPSPLRG